MRKTPAARAAAGAMLFALALALAWVESAAAPLAGLPPGVKMGLANIVVLHALLFLGRGQALLLVGLKAAAALFSRGAVAGALSLCGGALSLLVMLLLLLPRQKPSLVRLSVAGALGHNMGQLLLVRVLYGAAAWLYAPVLLFSAAGTGFLTALLLRALLPALQKTHPAPGAGTVPPRRAKEETDED